MTEAGLKHSSPSFPGRFCRSRLHKVGHHMTPPTSSDRLNGLPETPAPPCARATTARSDKEKRESREEEEYTYKRSPASHLHDNRTAKEFLVSNSYTDIMDAYEVMEKLGSGSFGTIRKIVRKSDKKVLVWKEIRYGRMNEKEKSMLVSEVNILRELKHPNIVRYK
eukprot:668363-Hanusia_phi.AAC.4